MKKLSMVALLAVLFFIGCTKAVETRNQSSSSVSDAQAGINLSKVYCSGSEEIYDSGSVLPDKVIGKIWNNGTSINLDEGDQLVDVAQVIVKGNDIHACGVAVR